MSYAAIEVELRDGKLISRGNEPLPMSGAGLLVILSGETKGAVPAAGSWIPTVNLIRQRQAARGHSPKTAEEVHSQLQGERESWD